MHSSLVVDTSVWASRIMARDINHLGSQIWSDRYIADGGAIIIPEFMLIELAATLTRQMRRPARAKQMAMGLYGGILSIRLMYTILAQTAMQLAADLRLKGADAVFVALAHQLSIPS